MHSPDEKLVCILEIKSEILRSAGVFLREQGFVEILPVIISPVTDPLHHTTFDGTINYYGNPYQLTKSMILHKQIALRNLERIFAFSPNIRLEPSASAQSGRHLAEFVQLDLEVRSATREEIMEIGEGLLERIIADVVKNCPAQLEGLSRSISPPKRPFARFSYGPAREQYGEGFEHILSENSDRPIWILDFPRHIREFYDREDPSRPGILVDMDLIYPEGYNEALSGGERENTLSRIRKRLTQNEIELSRYTPYLQAVKEGIPPSAGFGIGIERLTRYICGLDRLEETRLFPKTPGAIGMV
jgi:asparaginyl-tRNA synthetase